MEAPETPKACEGKVVNYSWKQPLLGRVVMKIAHDKGVYLFPSDISCPLKSLTGLSALPVYIGVLSTSGQLLTKILSAPFCGSFSS